MQLQSHHRLVTSIKQLHCHHGVRCRQCKLKMHHTIIIGIVIAVDLVEDDRHIVVIDHIRSIVEVDDQVEIHQAPMMMMIQNVVPVKVYSVIIMIVK